MIKLIENDMDIVQHPQLTNDLPLVSSVFLSVKELEKKRYMGLPVKISNCSKCE